MMHDPTRWSIMQSQFTQNGFVKNPTEWYQTHKDDYQRVLTRLRRSRRVLLDGDIDVAAENIRLSYLNAVFSIQTEKDRHERAFTAHVAGDTELREAALMTVYGGQKADWIERTLDKVDWTDVALAVRAHVREGRFDSLLDISEHLVGVSYTKWAFTLAMLGVWELACIDSNVATYFGWGRKAGVHNARDYLQLVEGVSESVEAGVPPFIAQWVIYDFQRGEHARHMPFYREIHLD